MEQNKLPEQILAWQLFGADFENFGKDNKPSVLPLPQIKDDELLVKIDAIGLCFSDVKLIRAGEEHPRVHSKNLKEDPVIPGHEAVMTVVKVGSKLEGQFKIGSRYIIQADIYVNGKNFAYGYALNGGMAQYSVIDQKVLNGDEGCYLLPIADSIPSAAAALFEPWTCVLASYNIAHRTAPLKNGRMLFVFGKDSAVTEVGTLIPASAPAEIVLVNAPAAFAGKIAQACPNAKITVASALPAEGKFDDIYLCACEKEIGEAAAKMGEVNACISFVGDYSGAWSFDVGSIHYQGWFYQGTETNDLDAAYGRNVRSTLKKGGTCWLPGGAGAMGQMHTQLAVSSKEGPKRVLVTDMDKVRIAHVQEFLGPIAKENGVELAFLNPADFADPAEFEKAVKEFAPEGFDDIVMLVPVAPLVSAYAKFLGKDGLMNIFAGIPAGKEATLCTCAIAKGGARFIGSSGSKTQDLRNTIEFVQRGILKPVSALAAIGGMNVLKEGLEAVAAAKFPGKTVIFPNCPDMPLTGVNDIASLVPGLEKTFDADGNYSVETEKALLAKFEK